MHSAPLFDANMAIACAVLLGAYILIFSQIIYRTSAAIIGAVVMVAAGMLSGFYSQDEAIRAVDANTILLLAGMMMIVALLKPTGAFEYLAIYIARAARGSGRLLLVYLSLMVSVISMFLDNVTTVLIFAPLTVLITRILALNPLPYLMAEAMLSNVGGAATLVGDPPNVMIASAAEISFMEFLVHMAPPVLLAWVVSTSMLLFIFRATFAGARHGRIDLDERRTIKDPTALKRALLVLGVVLVLFFIHHRLHLYPGYVVFIGVALALALLRPDPADLLAEVKWSILAFFAALFVIVGGVESSGLLHFIGLRLAQLAEDPAALLATCLLLMWVSAFLSAAVDNIPFTVIMLPIILGLETKGINIAPLWWALALGVGLGANGTHIGSTANVVVMAESETCGDPNARITPGAWMRAGMPTMVVGLIAVSALFALFFEYFR